MQHVLPNLHHTPPAAFGHASSHVQAVSSSSSSRLNLRHLEQ
jgi:hypothetical protein